MAARSKAYVCYRWLDGIAGSNSAGSMCLYVSCECYAAVRERPLPSGRSLVQGRPTECGVSEYDRESLDNKEELDL